MNTAKPLFKKTACSEKAAPVPESLSCPHCGQDIEIWSDEEETTCSLCGGSIRK